MSAAVFCASSMFLDVGLQKDSKQGFTLNIIMIYTNKKCEATNFSLAMTSGY